jgi:tRNA/rRNA methyltransferase
MSNFGFRHLRVVNPYAPAFREARSAVGAKALLAGAEKFDSVAAAVADCALVVGTTAVGNRELLHPLRPLEQGAGLIRTQLESSRVALLFGSERVGLPNSDLSHCHWLMRIPTLPERRSMNLGQAVAVCLYELIRDAKSARRPREREQAASASEMEQFSALLLSALRVSGYTDPKHATSSEEKMRRLVRRLQLPARDAEVWLGILRQLLWKMQSKKESAD